MIKHVPPITPLSNVEELTVAMTTAASFAKAHQHADLKVSALLVVHGGLIAATAAQFAPIRETYARGGGARWIVLALLVLLALGSLAAGYYLVQSLRPRTTPPKGTNRFAFPDVAQGPAAWPAAWPASASARSQCEEAWKLAKLLGTIALVKFRYTSRAIGWIAFMLVDFLALMAYVTVGSLPAG